MWLIQRDEKLQVVQNGVRHYACEMLMTAANDDVFCVSRCRSLPVRETITFIPTYPTKLTIFMTNASRFWQVRCYISGKVMIRSLRTTSKRTAIALAKKFYDANVLQQTSTNLSAEHPQQRNHSMESAARLMLQAEKARADRAEIASHAYTMTASRVRKQILPFFANMSVERVDYAQAERFLNHISALDYKSTTLTLYMLTLRKILITAQAHGWIAHVPALPKVRTKISARGWFNVHEYHTLVRAAWRTSKIIDSTKKITHRNTRGGIYTKTESVPHEMAWMIGFMVNSFMRPADLKLIQHKHVEIIRGEHTYLRLSLPESKRHKGQIITLPAAVRIYENLVLYFKDKDLAGSDDYLFLPNVMDRNGAIRLLEDYFRRLLISTQLRYTQHKQARTLYSLRHSAITFRLLYGNKIDLLTLARNARTSPEMIDKFYASGLSAEMNVAMLHSRRG